MARKAKFKQGNAVTYNGWLMFAIKDQYAYRGNQVVDIKDGEVTHLKVPVKNVQHHLIEVVDESTEDLTGKTFKLNKPLPLYLQEQPVSAVPVNKYQRTICEADTTNSLTVDVYDVLEAFKVTCPALQHLAKKALCVGIRGHKDTEQDLKDIIASAQRALALHYNRMGI